MAKYDVIHSCGHTEEHQLYGARRDRDGRRDWLSRQPCTDCWTVCWRAQQAAERAKANEAAAEANAAAGLPALVGTPKQIAWAESIRKPVAESLAAIELAGARRAAESGDPADREVVDAIILVAGEVLGHTEARWWIEEREGDPIRRRGDGVGLWLGEEISRRQLAPLMDAKIAERRAAHETKAAADSAAKAAADAERRATEETERQAKQAARESAEHRLDTLRIAAVECKGEEGSTIAIRSADGRTASGWILDGAWAISTVDGMECDSTSVAAERLAAAAKRHWAGAEEVTCG